MKAEMLKSTEGIPGTSVVISHGDARLVFDITSFDKVKFEWRYDVFRELNDYWRSRSEQEQQDIFNCYNEIDTVLKNIFNSKELIKKLRPHCKRLFALHNYNDIHKWAMFYPKIRIPKNDKLVDEFTQEDGSSYPQETTYTKSEYFDLVVLTIKLKTMHAVFGDFITKTINEVGTKFKETTAYSLLDGLDIHELPSMKKLVTFIVKTSGADKVIPFEVLKYYGSEEYPKYVTAILIMRRIIYGDISGNDPTSTLVSNCYKYIMTNVVRNQKGQGSNMVRDKDENKLRGVTSEEQEPSVLERFKLLPDLSVGDIEPIDVYTEDVHRIVKAIVPDIDMDFLEMSLESVRALETQDVGDGQEILVACTLRKEIQPRAIDHFSPKTFLRLLAATQAILWHKGMRELAALSTAYPLRSTKALLLSPSASYGRLSREHAEILNKYYPFHYKQAGEKKGNKPVSPAIVNIEVLTTLLTEHEWALTLPDPWIKELCGKVVRRYSPTYEIRSRIAEFAIALAERKL